MPLLNNKQRTPVWKVALIPILLVGLIWNVTRDQPDSPPAAVAETASKPSDGEDSVLSVTDLLSELARTRRAEAARPSLSLSEVVAHDPFSVMGELARLSGETGVPGIVPGKGPDTAIAGNTAAAPPVLRNPVQAVLHGPQGAAALVDSRIVRVGDFLEPDVRVIAIEADAVVLEAVAQPFESFGRDDAEL